MTIELRLILAALAAYRLTTMLVYDEGPWRIFLLWRIAMGAYDRGANGQPVTLKGRLAECPYCMGVYVGLVVSIAVLWPGGVGDCVLVVLGLMGATALLTGLAGR